MLLRILHRWHRRMGIASTLFVIMLVITGLLLNHTEALELKKYFIQNDFLLDLYNINPDKEPVGFLLADRWIVQLGDRVYFDHYEIADHVRQLIGIVALEGGVVIAFDGQLWMVNNEGDVIERFTGAEGVPAGMRAIGITAGRQPVIRGAHGDYLVDLDNLKWHEEKMIEAVWSVPQPVPEERLTHLLRLYRGKGLPLERVLLDLHSGRLFGSYGVYVIDAAAILFFLLALSGVWMWTRRKHA